MTPLTSLLLAVDASPYAEASARYAGFFSTALELPLKVVHVLDTRTAGGAPALDAGMGDLTLEMSDFGASLSAALQGRGDEIAASTEALLASLGVRAETEIAAGFPAAEILERADEETLIVLGKRGEEAAAIGTTKLGSVSERVVRRADGPVLLVPDSFTKPQRLLLGYDGSKGAEGALEYVVSLARTLSLPVHALNVHRHEATAQDQLAAVRARAGRDGLHLTTEYRYGDPTEAILSATREGDIVAIGAFGTGRLAEFFRGSITTDVVRQANVPVLLHH